MSSAPGKELNNTVPDGLSDQDPMDDHEAKGHLDTLMNAHHILNNPDKMARVHAVAGRHQEALHGIKSTDALRDIYKQKFGVGHLVSSQHQENDLGGGEKSNGNGSTGNKGSGSRSQGHSKGSRSQENQLGDGEPDNGTGYSANKSGDAQLKGAGFNKSSKKQGNEVKTPGLKNGTGNDG